VLRSRLRRSKEAKLVVFFSNCDSVDFHHALLQQPQPGGGETDSYEAAAAGGEAGELLLGSCAVLKLHGDMKQPERTSSLVTFSKVRGNSGPSALCSCVLDTCRRRVLGAMQRGQEAEGHWLWRR
jgi:ATP-dependent RNA helicase DDX31/DBP7